jgi:putative ABC transport system ATP-binding protein
MSAIHLKGLTHAWPGQAPLFEIDELTVQQGRHLFIQGPSGCGKSTLLSLLAGVQAVQSGVCEVLGRDMGRLSDVERDRIRGEHIGVIFQQFNLLSYLDVQSNVLMPIRLFPSRLKASMAVWGSPVEQAKALAQALGLGEKMWRQPINQLSVGQQQRVAAVRALMGAPELVIADEPTSALDDARQLEFLDLLLHTAEKQNTTVIMVSHNARLANRFDQVFEMHAGDHS